MFKLFPDFIVFFTRTFNRHLPADPGDHSNVVAMDYSTAFKSLTKGMDEFKTPEVKVDLVIFMEIFCLEAQKIVLRYRIHRLL